MVSVSSFSILTSKQNGHQIVHQGRTVSSYFFLGMCVQHILQQVFVFLILSEGENNGCSSMVSGVTGCDRCKSRGYDMT